MSKNLTWRLLALTLVLAVLLTGCGAPAELTMTPESTQPGEATTAPEPPPAGEVQEFVTWYQYDQDNTDPANDEAVGNAYLRDTIPQFNEALAGKWNWINVPKVVFAGAKHPSPLRAQQRSPRWGGSKCFLRPSG